MGEPRRALAINGESGDYIEPAPLPLTDAELGALVRRCAVEFHTQTNDEYDSSIGMVRRGHPTAELRMQTLDYNDFRRMAQTLFPH